MNAKRIEISYRTIIFTVLFLISLYVLWQIRSIIVLLFICFILMEALNPAVKKLEDMRIPRPLAILLLYIIIIGVFAFGIASIVPILVDQTGGLIRTLPQHLENVTLFGTSAIDISSQFRILESLPANIARATFGIVSNIFSVFVIFVITFYLTLERKNFGKYSFSLFGQQGKAKAIKIIDQLETTLGSWVNAQLFLMLIIGILAYIGYVILGIPYAVPLAILAGLTEIVPNIGPTVATAIAAFVALTVSPLTALLVVGWGILIQQLESNFIVPKVMSERVGLNPLVTIILIATGARLGGVLGAILIIPAFLTIQVIVRALINSENKVK